jgi:hypothetical protein
VVFYPLIHSLNLSHYFSLLDFNPTTPLSLLTQLNHTGRSSPAPAPEQILASAPASPHATPPCSLPPCAAASPSHRRTPEPPPHVASLDPRQSRHPRRRPCTRSHALARAVRCRRVKRSACLPRFSLPLLIQRAPQSPPPPLAAPSSGFDSQPPRLGSVALARGSLLLRPSLGGRTVLLHYLTGKHVSSVPFRISNACLLSV